MSRKHAIHLAACASTIVFALVLPLPAFVHVPVLWYLPVEHTWRFAVHVDGIAIDFIGCCLLATLASAVVGFVTFAVLRSPGRREPSRKTIALFSVWAISLTLLAVTFFACR